MNGKLRLNKETGYYESYMLVEREILYQVLFAYAKEHDIDPTDPEEWQKAIDDVSDIERWRNHPRTQWTAPQKPEAGLPQCSPTLETKALSQEPPKGPPYLTAEEKQALREKALALPVDRWETLKTPLPRGLPPGESKEKDRIYRRREEESRVLKALVKELEPAKLETLQAIAGAVNGNGIK